MQGESRNVDDMLIEASELFKARRDEEALSLSRLACNQLFAMFHGEMRGDTLVKLLSGLRGLAVEAFVTGRNNEGLTALGTALAYADVGLKHWPSAPPLLAERDALQDLEKKVSARPTVLIRDQDADDWTWPFND
jgi:hypothetical protein